jgi:hypothetical protein
MQHSLYCREHMYCREHSSTACDKRSPWQHSRLWDNQQWSRLCAMERQQRCHPTSTKQQHQQHHPASVTSAGSRKQEVLPAAPTSKAPAASASPMAV